MEYFFELDEYGFAVPVMGTEEEYSFRNKFQSLFDLLVNLILFLHQSDYFAEDFFADHIIVLVAVAPTQLCNPPADFSTCQDRPHPHQIGVLFRYLCKLHGGFDHPGWLSICG